MNGKNSYLCFSFSLNDAYCEAIASTPFRVLYGTDPISPMRLINKRAMEPLMLDESSTPTQWEEKTAEQLQEVWEFIKRHQKEIAQRMKERYDMFRKPASFQHGDLVLLSTKSYKNVLGYKKHQPKYIGPYIIDSKVNDNAYKLIGLPPRHPKTQNVKYLRLFRPSPAKFANRGTPEANIPEIADGEPRWEIERILDDREAIDNVSFLVKWLGDPVQQWIPVQCLDRCSQLLREYYMEKEKPIPEIVKAVMENVTNERRNTNGNRNLISYSPEDSSDSDWTPSGR